MGASPKEQIAPGGLAPVESVPNQGDIEERVQWGGRYDLHPCRRHGNVSAHHLRHQRGLGPGGGDHHAGLDRARGRLHRRDPAVDDLHARDGGVLVEPAAQVLESPCECLDRALGVGVAAIGGKHPAERPVGDPGDHVLYLQGVEQIYTYAVAKRVVPIRVDVAHLLFRHGDLEPALLCELGGIAQLIVQSLPYLQRLHAHRYQRRLVNPLADHPTISPGGLASDGPLLDHHNILARLGQEVGRGQAGNAAPDDDYVRTV